MRKLTTTVVAVSAVALTLSACGRAEQTSTSTQSSGGSAAAKGFDPGALIGVALPKKTSENWVLAENIFKKDMTDAGFKVDVQFANNGVAEQQNQIQTMVTKGAKVLIVGALDGSQLGTQLQAAKQQGVTVIAYDRLLTNTQAVDYYVAFDNFKVGVLQGNALLEGLKAKKPNGPYNVELIAGSPDDANSKVFFDGAMSVLQPKIKDGSVPLDGVLSPNDTLARAAMTSVKQAGKPTPVVTGQDSEVESVKSIMAGEQYSTINKDTRKLVAAAIDMTKQLQKGEKVTVNDEKSYNNGVKVVPANLLEPVIVTKANAKEAYANDPTLSALVK